MKPWVYVLVFLVLLLVGVWIYMLWSIINDGRSGGNDVFSFRGADIPLQTVQKNIDTPIKEIESVPLVLPTMELIEPVRYKTEVRFLEPPPLIDIEKNLTYYLNTLHARLGALAGPSCDPMEVWETFVDVTKNTLIKWDDQNRNRFPKIRHDNSIFVSLGTYRDPYCPMTIKSLFDQAEHPERLYVGLFQQNCFEKTCRTGVLKGGVVEDMSTDVDCYKEFCASKEGIKSGACLDDRIRLFNVNESESLGPYMARYLGAKFYRGEQYYLQIDSHSEFVKNWDSKLIKMVENAPAKKVRILDSFFKILVLLITFLNAFFPLACYFYLSTRFHSQLERYHRFSYV